MTERISIVTDEISQDLGEVRAFLDAKGVAAVELRTVGGRRAPDIDPDDRAVLRAWARDGDPAVLAVSPGLFKCRVADRGETRRHLEEVLPRSLDLAADLGASFLVAFGFDDPDRLGVTPDAVDALRTAADDCAAAGLPLLVENEPGFLAGTAAEVKALLSAVDHENLFVNWDPANGNEFDAHRLEAGLRALFPRVRHVHVKNGVLHPGERFARCCSLEEGGIDWRSHLSLLADLGYAGHLGVETHYEPVMEASAVVLEELRRMARGAGFPWSPRE